MKNSPRLSVCVTGTILLIIWVTPAGAVPKSWEPIGGSTNWHFGPNWDPDGIPGDNDDVAIGNGSLVNLFADTANVNSLNLTGGLLQSNGFRLNVDDGGNGLLTVAGSGVGGGILSLVPVVSGHGMRADDIVIADGGEIVQSNGTTSIVDGVLTIQTGGSLRTFNGGAVNFFSTQAGAELINNGTIRADGFFSSIEQVTNATFDLDGTTGNGVVNVTSGSRFFVNGALSDAFNGTINIGSGGADARLNMQQAWINSAGENPGVVNLDAGELSGATVTNNGEIRGHGSITAQDVVNHGTISADGGTLLVDTIADFPEVDGNNDPNAVLNAVTGDLEIIFNSVAGSGATFAGQINVGPGHELRTPMHQVILLNNGQVNLTGGAMIGGGLTVSLLGTPAVTLNVLGGLESRLEATKRNDFTTGQIITLDGDLRLVGTSLIDDTVTFTGTHTLINDAASFLHTFDGANIGVTLRNEGTLNIGFGGGDAEQIAAAAFVQTASGKLQIQFEGTEPEDFDHIIVAGPAQLDGMLELDLIPFFNPSLGQSFPILAAASVSGTFDALVMPVLDPGLFWSIRYEPTLVTLEVVDTLPGDFNSDGRVDAADYALWRSDPSSYGGAQGYTDWVNNFGAMFAGGAARFAPGDSSGASYAVPEPASAVLAAIIGLAAVFVSRLRCGAMWTSGRLVYSNRETVVPA